MRRRLLGSRHRRSRCKRDIVADIAITACERLAVACLAPQVRRSSQLSFSILAILVAEPPATHRLLLHVPFRPRLTCFSRPLPPAASRRPAASQERKRALAARPAAE